MASAGIKGFRMSLALEHGLEVAMPVWSDTFSFGPTS